MHKVRYMIICRVIEKGVKKSSRLNIPVIASIFLDLEDLCPSKK